jgi:hypothetical protein
MRIRLATWAAMAMVSTALPDNAPSRSDTTTAIATSEVYIQQARGRVAPGANIPTKPPPETTMTVAPAPAPPMAPATCNAQNASSQACYTATQQSRPAGR